MKQEVELGDVFKHIKSGREYVVSGFIDVKIDGLWTQVVVYFNMEEQDSKEWGRPIDNFKEKFKKIL